MSSGSQDVYESESHLVMSNSLQAQELQAPDLSKP